MAKRVKKSELDPIIRECFEEAFEAECSGHKFSIDDLKINAIYGRLIVSHEGFLDNFSKVTKRFAYELSVYFGNNIVPHYTYYQTASQYSNTYTYHITLSIDYEIIMDE